MTGRYNEETEFRRTLSTLKDGDKVKATFRSKNGRRTYRVQGKVYTIASYPRVLFIGDEQTVFYHDGDGILVPNQYLKRISRTW